MIHYKGFCINTIAIDNNKVSANVHIPATVPGGFPTPHTPAPLFSKTISRTFDERNAQDLSGLVLSRTRTPKQTVRLAVDACREWIDERLEIFEAIDALEKEEERS